ncbi:head maturation protease, ClpP-related, partial [Escherichia coli]|uniref:head maturation protease, ClpP-related n=1 Tax=Escherichia coli TaxID=562 RepID=UPI000AD79C97
MPQRNDSSRSTPTTSPKNNSWFRMQAGHQSDADIYIYDEIGFWGVTAKQFISDLNALGDITHINLHINSPGGDVFEGIAIFNALKTHGASITVYVDGVAASMASVIAMVGNPVIMPENTFMMIHKPFGFTGGDAEDMRTYADLLDKVEAVLLPAYAQKTGKTTDEIAAMLADETWMSGAECLAHGFADQVTPAVKAMACIQSKRTEEFKKMPESIRNMITPPRNSAPRVQDNEPEASRTPVQAAAPVVDENSIRAQVLAEQKARVNGINDLFAMFGGRYPNTALVGVQVDSEQFGSQQVSRNYHLRGRILQVPSNYNPQTRQYSGIWDGTLKPAYSNNMAWCLWDMLTHPRYGMGKRLGAADVDKWALYVIGQYCDQSVPDGFGGTEPRITCNAWLTTQRKAWDVLSDFCSAMRCMPVWNGQTLTFVQDRPSDKVWTYNRSNVVMPDDGAPFRYSFSALKDRHNAVEVNWIDPNNGWETATELVEDTQAIARYGRNVTKMDAFGCTSRGQAHRAGLWLIKTELLETQTVDFSVGAEGLRHVPGDVIEICDDDYAGIRTGGRVLAVNSQTRTLTLDREITLPSSGTTLISLVDGSGNPVSVEVQSVTDGVKVKVSRVPDGVAEYSVWGLKLPTLRQRLFRCVSIRENDDGTYAITAVQH